MIVRAALSGLTLAVCATAVLAAPEDRFKGGGIDGYDDKTLAQTSDDMSRVWARYKGNGYDGYGQAGAQGARLPIRGTVIMVR
jgi:hypothetical protein